MKIVKFIGFQEGLCMKNNSLINTNKYLKNRKKREKMIVRFAYNSGKSEGLKITLKETREAYKTALTG